MPARLLACLLVAIALSGCKDGAVIEAPVDVAAAQAAADTPAVNGEVSAGNAELLAQSALGMVTRVAAVGSIATTMLRDHVRLMSNPLLTTWDIARCADSPDGYNFETNQIRFQDLAEGYYLPAGPSLHVALSNCTVEGLRVSGFMDITAIHYVGDPAGDGPWTIEAVLSLGPIEIAHDNGTTTSITDRVRYLARHSDGRLETTLTIAADPDAGVVGGVNAQHYDGPIAEGTTNISYQLRPFRIRSVEDGPDGEYTLAIERGPEGASRLNRYTNAPATEVILEMETAPGQPLRWAGERPEAYDEEAPASGEVRMAAGCDDCGSILAVVDGGEVTLSVEADGAVTTEQPPWSELLATPEAP